MYREILIKELIPVHWENLAIEYAIVRCVDADSFFALVEQWKLNNPI